MTNNGSSDQVMNCFFRAKISASALQILEMAGYAPRCVRPVETKEGLVMLFRNRDFFSEQTASLTNMASSREAAVCAMRPMMRSCRSVVKTAAGVVSRRSGMDFGIRVTL